MEFTSYNIQGLASFTSRVFEDERGHFFESYNKEVLEPILANTEFMQDNQSLSKKNVLRGLHFQKPPFAQGKLVRVIQGAVLDVAVDIRSGSSTYGEHVKIILSAENNLNFWIPEGFAHGFLALEDDTIFSYKCTRGYNAASEESILWNDQELSIEWGVDSPIVASKDEDAQVFSEFKSSFEL